MIDSGYWLGFLGVKLFRIWMNWIDDGEDGWMD